MCKKGLTRSQNKFWLTFLSLTTPRLIAWAMRGASTKGKKLGSIAVANSGRPEGVPVKLLSSIERLALMSAAGSIARLDG